jgi:hypothetical protein
MVVRETLPTSRLLYKPQSPVDDMELRSHCLHNDQSGYMSSTLPPCQAWTSDNPLSVAHGLTLLHEIRTWCCVGKGAIAKLLFPITPSYRKEALLLLCPQYPFPRHRPRWRCSRLRLRLVRLHIRWRLLPRSRPLHALFPEGSHRASRQRLAEWDPILAAIRPGIQSMLPEMPCRQLLEASSTFETRHRLLGHAFPPVDGL